MKSMQGSSQAGRSGRPSPAAPSAITFLIPTRHSKTVGAHLPAMRCRLPSGPMGNGGRNPLGRTRIFARRAGGSTKASPRAS